jgi:hypothetical protein
VSNGKRRKADANKSEAETGTRRQLSLNKRFLASLRLGVFALNGRGVPWGDELEAQARAE